VLATFIKVQASYHQSQHHATTSIFITALLATSMSFAAQAKLMLALPPDGLS
jgi:hypothetical protein